MSNETIGGLKRLSLYLSGQLKSAVSITGGAIDGTPIGATSASTVYASRFADAVETGTTATDLAAGGTSLLSSTAAATYTLPAPTRAGIYKFLHSTSASTMTVATGIQVGDSSSLTKLVFAGKSSIFLKSDSTAIWYPYGSYQSTLITLSA